MLHLQDVDESLNEVKSESQDIADELQVNDTCAFHEYLETIEAQLQSMPAHFLKSVEDAYFEESTISQVSINCNEATSSKTATPSEEYNHNEDVNPGVEYECHSASFEGATHNNQEYSDEGHGW